MHIALNAAAVQRRFYGVGTYVLNLIRNLAQVDSANRYTLYASRENTGIFHQLGLRHQIIPTPSLRPFRLLWEQTWLPFDLARKKVDVFHGLGFVSPFTAVCPQVITVHDMTFSLFPRKHTFAKRHYFPLAIRLSVKRSDMVIAVSESVKKDLVRLLNIPPEKVRVIYHGVDERFRCTSDPPRLARLRVKYNLSKKVILFLGVIEPRKNVAALIRAFADLKALHQDYCLVIAGDWGWGYDETLQTVRDRRVSEHVFFPGFIPQEELPDFYNLADVFVYPSLYEGFGLPVLEAMACGVPVVTSNVSALPEVVGDAGLLIDPASREDLAAAIVRAVTDNELRTKMSQKGRERSRLFSWEKAARETASVYEAVARLGGRTKRGSVDLPED